MQKKLLMISYRFPWPEEKGGYNLRFLNFSKILRQKYTLSLLTLVENKQEENNIKKLKEEKIFEEVIYFYHPKMKEYKNTFLGFFSTLPLQVHYYYSKNLMTWLQKNYQNYNLLYFSTLRTAIYYYQLKTANNQPPPAVIDLIDSISLNYCEAKKWSKNPFWQLIYKIEIPRLQNFEKQIIEDNKFRKIFISSEFDKNYLISNQKLTNYNSKITVISNGVKESLIKNEKQQVEENIISFFGKMDTQPNQDAAIFFAKKIFPKIQKDPRFHELKFYIIGTSPTPKIKNLEKIKNVKVTGYLKNPYEILERSKLIVSPLRFGAGMQNKVIEAMALEKAVVSSEISARGISKSKPGKYFEAINSFDPRLWQEKIIELLLNQQKRETLGNTAKEFIKENYSWEKIGKSLLKEISYEN